MPEESPTRGWKDGEGKAFCKRPAPPVGALPSAVSDGRPSAGKNKTKIHKTKIEYMAYTRQAE